MRFLTLFSGIGAPEVAWQPLGWQCIGQAEIDPSANAVLRHRFPDVPNLGDIAAITEDQIAALGPIDLIIGGFPCQDLSVAGKRKGLRDEQGNATRSGLFFEAMRLVRIARRRCGLRWLIIENVPGLYSSNAGLDFGAVVAEIVGTGFDVPRDGWANSGAAAGPDGLVEWATLDAQFFGLAQRRERVFLVGDFGDWPNRPPVLLEPESMLGNPAPRREKREDVAGTLSARSTAGGGLGTDFECQGVIADEVARSVKASDMGHRHDPSTDNYITEKVAPPITGNPYGDHESREGLLVAYGGSNSSGEINVSTALNAHGGTHGRLDFESETFIAETLRSHPRPGSNAVGAIVAEPIPILEVNKGATSRGAGPNGCGIGNAGDPMFTLQAGAQHAVAEPIPFGTTQMTSRENRSRPRPGDPSPTLAKAAHAPCIAFTCKDYGQDATRDISPPLRAMNEVEGNANAGGQVAIAFNARQDPISAEECGLPLDTDGTTQAIAFKPSHYTRGKDGAPSEVSPPLSADADKGDQEPVIFESRFARNGRGAPEEVCPPLKAQSGETGKGDSAPLVASAWAVRRLTPTECERLQGLADGWTLVPYRNALAKDGPRYKMCGNAMATTVVRYIGERIAAVSNCAALSVAVKESPSSGHAAL